MICGNKQDIEKILPYVSEGLQKALQYIKETNFAEVKNGEYEIDGRDVFVRINTYATEDKINKKPESSIISILMSSIRCREEILFTPRRAEHIVSGRSCR